MNDSVLDHLADSTWDSIACRGCQEIKAVEFEDPSDSDGLPSMICRDCLSVVLERLRYRWKSGSLLKGNRAPKEHLDEVQRLEKLLGKD